VKIFTKKTHLPLAISGKRYNCSILGKSDSSTSGPGTVMESRVEQQLLAQYPQGLHSK
jgi:hypothetical protein